ncbi:MAG: protease inhibitor I42 family protein [Burkholderiales bacterium]
MRRAAALAAFALAACASTAQQPGTSAPAPAAPASQPAALTPPEANHRVLPPPAQVTSVDLDNAADGTKVTLKRGNELKVLLDADPRTGFHWRYPAGFAPTLAQIGERIFLTKSGIYLGTGGWNVFRYRAEQPGTVTLLFAYGPFDDAAPATKSVRYHVTVE